MNAEVSFGVSTSGWKRRPMTGLGAVRGPVLSTGERPVGRARLAGASRAGPWRRGRVTVPGLVPARFAVDDLQDGLSVTTGSHDHEEPVSSVRINHLNLVFTFVFIFFIS